VGEAQVGREIFRTRVNEVICEYVVVYGYPADNSLSTKTRYNALISPPSAGALPWYQFSFSTNSGTVEIMEKVRKYAGAEIDARLFISMKFWMLTIASSVVSAGCGYADRAPLRLL
jgi:hypothetical protein